MSFRAFRPLPALALLSALLSACTGYPAGMSPDALSTASTRVTVDAVRARGALLGEVRSPIVAAGGMNLVARGGGHVLVGNGRQLVAAGGGNIVSNAGGAVMVNNSGNVVAAGGMNGQQGAIVAAGGMNYRLTDLAPDDLTEVPVEGATVFLRDALTLAVLTDVPPTTTDETGSFAFVDVPLDQPYVIEAVALGETGDGVRLTAVARAAAGDAPRSPVAVTVASTLVAARVAEATDEHRGGVYGLEPGAVAEAVEAIHVQLKADRIALRMAAKGLRVKTSGRPEDATVAADYQPQAFAGSADASARVEAKEARTQARVGKVRQAIDPAVAVPVAPDDEEAGQGEKPSGSKPADGASPTPGAGEDAETPAGATGTGGGASTAGGQAGGQAGGKSSGASGGSSAGSSGGSSGGSAGGGSSGGGSSGGGSKGGGKAK